MSAPHLAEQNSAISRWGKTGKWSKALEVLRELPEMTLKANIVSYNAAAGASLRNDVWAVAVKLISETKKKCFQADAITLSSSLRACSEGRWFAALCFLEEFANDALEPDIIAYSSATSLFQCGERWKNMLLLLNQAERSQMKLDVVACSAAITCCHKGGQWQWSLQLLRHFQRNGTLNPNIILYNATVSSCESGAQWEKAMALLAEAQCQDLQVDIITYNAATSVCEKSSQWRCALHLFAEAQAVQLQIDLITFSSAISAFEKSGRWQEALHLYGQISAGLQIDLITCNAVISACEKGAKWQEACHVLSELVRWQLQGNSTTNNAVLSAFQKSTQWELALKMFWQLRKTGMLDVISYNSAIAACIHWRQTLQLFTDLKTGGTSQTGDIVTYSSLISSCDWQWQIAVKLLESSPKKDGILYIAAMSSCDRCSSWPTVMSLLSKLEVPKEVDTAAYEIFLRSCEEGGLTKKTLSLLEDLEDEAWSFLRKVLCLLKSYQEIPNFDQFLQL